MNALNRVALLSLITIAAGCQTHHEIVVSQPKPLEVNLNLTGRLELVITDARQNLEQITGAKPRRIVNPEDIGLPTAEESATTGPGASAQLLGTAPMYLSAAPVQLVQADREAALKQSMAARNDQVRAILSAHKAGEAHTGLLVAKESPTAQQQSLIDAENKDRAELYRLESQRKGVKESDVALGYYVARLGYAQKGDWVEKFDKKAKQWNWIRWEQE